MYFIITAANIDKLLSQYSFVDGAKTPEAEKTIAQSKMKRKDVYHKSYVCGDDGMFNLYVEKKYGHMLIEKPGYGQEGDWVKLHIIKAMIEDGMIDID